MHIHVKAGSDAGREILHDAQLRESIDGIIRQFCLAGPDYFFQPALKLHTVSHGAEKCHSCMGVGIFKSGHQQIALQVNLPLKNGHIVPDGPDIRDHLSVCPDLFIGYAHIRRKAKHFAVVKTNHKLFSLSF